MKLNDTIKHFLSKQHYVVVSTLDKKGMLHTSLKGLVEIEPSGKILLLDLYKTRTYENISNNPNVALTAVDDKCFKGLSLSGKAKIIERVNIPKKKLDIWHERLAKRIARRVITHVKENRGESESIPEAKFPLPQYLIEVTVERVVDLAPKKIISEQKSGG